MNVDGVSLHSSTHKTMWPILISVVIKPRKLCASVITYGSRKPTNNDFLKETIDELSNLIHDGLIVNTIKYTIQLNAIVCDATARSMIKSIISHTGYYSCERCTLKREYFNHCIAFNEVNFTERNMERFVEQVQKEHYRGVSLLLPLPIHMIKDFPIDYMHQSCLGVMKRLLKTW